jgi:hypothetical protein
MKFDLTPFPVGELIEAFESGSIARNPEYQRGAAWSVQQKQALIDSVFREYPLPAFFFEVRAKRGLGGKSNEKHEIIDGQQRLLALLEFKADNFELLKSSDTKLRLPLSMREPPAPWEGKRFTDLTPALRKRFLGTNVQVYLVKDVANPDEVRDLFIRLQSGTALTRQQIRDAWPGQLGPQVERWAGKLTMHPKYSFFRAVDGRGTRDDEDDTKDPYVKHRTTCAQLCQLLMGRAESPFSTPSIKAGDLDGLYHRYTVFDSTNNPLASIAEILDDIESVIDRIAGKPKGKRKVPKIALFALALFLQDVRRGGNLRLTTESKEKLANAVTEPDIKQNSRASSGGVIRDYYDRWRATLPEGIAVALDPKRLFDEPDKKKLRKAANGMCGLCNEAVAAEDEEYDHHPIPYRDGGRTTIDNGRLVHKECHPRGRPRKDA